MYVGLDGHHAGFPAIRADNVEFVHAPRWYPVIMRRRWQGVVAAGVAGIAVCVLVVWIALPELAARLSDPRVEWLRRAFADNPVFVIATILMAVAVPAFMIVGGIWMANDRRQ